MTKKKINAYAKGRKAEYLARDELKKYGFNVIRSAGSHSPVDLIATDINCVRFIQVKNYEARAKVGSLRKDIAKLEAWKLNAPGFCRFEVWIKQKRKDEFEKILV